MHAVYANIRNRRIDLGLTQEELRLKMGYKDKVSISRIERGEVDLPLSKILKFAEVLEISVPELMGFGMTDDDMQHYTSVRARTTELLAEKYSLSPDIVRAFRDVSPEEASLAIELIACVKRNTGRIVQANQVQKVAAYHKYLNELKPDERAHLEKYLLEISNIILDTAK